MNEANSIWALVHDDGPIPLRKRRKQCVYECVDVYMYVLRLIA